MSNAPQANTSRPAPDPLLTQIADYVFDPGRASGALAIETARLCLMDTLGCGFLALGYAACTRLLGPIVPGATLPGRGARVPGTAHELEPVQAAFNRGAMVRWLDFNDTWLAAEWGHPSDNLGAILAVADYRSRAGEPMLVRDILVAMVQAHEIQGVLALENAFNRVGLDHVLLVRIASAAVATRLLGGSRGQVINAVSNAFLDGGALRAYRHAPNTGSRKSWAAGDATSRGVRHGLMALAGEMGYPGALSTATWGFQDVVLRGKPLVVPEQGFGSYVMENILFKISYPAEFHAQTAVEAAVALQPEVTPNLADVKRIVIETQEGGRRIIDKTGPLSNPADRDHCLQYMVAVGLLKGSLAAADYEDAAAADPRIDALRGTMEVIENPAFTRDYLDPAKRSIGNAVQVFFRDGGSTRRVSVEYPIGHRRRRGEGASLLASKFESAVRGHFPGARADTVAALFARPEALDGMPVGEFMGLLSGWDRADSGGLAK
jgi:2-methylcitrate dehydratase